MHMGFTDMVDSEPTVEKMLHISLNNKKMNTIQIGYVLGQPRSLISNLKTLFSSTLSFCFCNLSLTEMAVKASSLERKLWGKLKGHWRLKEEPQKPNKATEHSSKVTDFHTIIHKEPLWIILVLLLWNKIKTWQGFKGLGSNSLITWVSRSRIWGLVFRGRIVIVVGLFCFWIRDSAALWSRHIMAFLSEGCLLPLISFSPQRSPRFRLWYYAVVPI